MPLLRELRRVLRPDGELWLSCPDMESICRSYNQGKIKAMIADRQHRFPEFTLNGMPSSQMVNELFHQSGQHKNLFDLPLLEWCLNEAGFSEVVRVAEADLIARFPEFPSRGDDEQTLYVRAV